MSQSALQKEIFGKHVAPRSDTVANSLTKGFG